jgi:ferric-dicitrate binding protein FerR (iron transport regulator)
MNNINNYQLDDFVQDLDFRKWVNGFETERNWEEWVKANPAKADMIDAARSLVQVTGIEELGAARHNSSETDIAFIMSSVNQTPRINWRKALTIAASVMVILALPIFMLWNSKSSVKESLGLADRQGTVMENNGKESLSLMLADSTTVILKKGSKLIVAQDFGAQSRTVRLIGEALFEVKKDSQHPFLVYAGGVVTKVLGTVFVVRAYQDEESTVVSVQKGHVSVTKNDKQEVAGKNGEQIFLLPNQKGVYRKSDSRLIKSVVDNPVILAGNDSEGKFYFQETPIPKVFAKLEQVYGIKIVYDQELLEKCNLTAVFEGDTLFEIVDIVCETIKASSQVAEGQIIIYAKGCK